MATHIGTWLKKKDGTEVPAPPGFDPRHPDPKVWEEIERTSTATKPPRVTDKSST